MPQFDDSALTTAVVNSFEESNDLRLKFLMEELVTALHGFVRRTNLSSEEWGAAIDFLTRTGQKCGPGRQEFILLSDVLGVSMLVDALNHKDRGEATQTTLLGPFYVGEHRPLPHGADISEKVEGDPMFVQCRVTDLRGKPLAGVTVDVWHADDEGFYDSQKPSYASDGPSLRARFTTDADGRLYFRTILPRNYLIPIDGPVGELILATRRYPMRPAHVHFLLNAKGFEPLVTDIFIEGDSYLDSDVVFGVKEDLISSIELRAEPTMPDGLPADGPWHLMTYDFRLKPGRGVAPKPMAPVSVDA
ncbi:MAG TPA: dioxygenase [Rhodopseudomonas sp.]|uniref:dioxygenase family protein n=1 Tax=Rhodopseudomonas sp. TaxID=1078 RepID=UPI002ED957BF